jgi:hypothetical protein
MSLTQTGQRLLADAQTILAHAEAATQRLRENQTTHDVPRNVCRCFLQKKFSDVPRDCPVKMGIPTDVLQVPQSLPRILSITNHCIPPFAAA